MQVLLAGVSRRAQARRGAHKLGPGASRSFFQCIIRFSGCWRALAKGTAWAGFYCEILLLSSDKAKSPSAGRSSNIPGSSSLLTGFGLPAGGERNRSTLALRFAGETKHALASWTSPSACVRLWELWETSGILWGISGTSPLRGQYDMLICVRDVLGAMYWRRCHRRK